MTTQAFKSPALLSIPIKPAPLVWALGLGSILATVVAGLPSLVEYDAVAIGSGQIWRVFTGHLTHWNLDHLFWDVGVFLALGTLCEWHSRRATLACIIGSALATSLVMYLTLPEITTYRGLSGIDTGLFTLLGVQVYRDSRKDGDRTVRWLIAGIAAALLAKLTFEIVTGCTLFVDHQQAHFIPLASAHILGAVTGILTGVVDRHGMS